MSTMTRRFDFSSCARASLIGATFAACLFLPSFAAETPSKKQQVPPKAAVPAARFKDVQEAAAGIDSASVSDRLEAARYLALEKVVGQIPALSRRLAKETDRNVKQAIAVSLANLGVPAFNALKSALADSLPEVRMEAAVGLGRIGTPSAGAELAALFARETNDGVRQTTLFWLGEMKYSPATEALGSALKDANPNLRAQAAHSLGRLGSARAKTLLQTAPSDADPKVRKVVESLKR